MPRAPKAQTTFFVVSIVAAIAAIGAISLLSAALLEGRAVMVVEDITLDVVIGCLIVIGPAGLLLWQQLRQRCQRHFESDPGLPISAL